jgi:hypothetical protein
MVTKKKQALVFAFDVCGFRVRCMEGCEAVAKP